MIQFNLIGVIDRDSSNLQKIGTTQKGSLGFTTWVMFITLCESYTDYKKRF